jgi:general nucleoside transport system permease protein
MIFGNWQPGSAFVGAMLFGSADALQQRQDVCVHALLVALAIMVGLGALLMFYRKRVKGGVALALVCALLIVWCSVSDTVPRPFVQSTGHLATLIVLVWSTQRLRPPAAEGVHFGKGED